MTGPVTSSAANAPTALRAATAPTGWHELRDDPDIQFEPLSAKPLPPREPGWLERVLDTVFEFLGELLGPIGEAIAWSWPVLKWGLLGALTLFVLMLLARTIGPLARRIADRDRDEPEREWQPEQADTLALLEDADRLAQAGRFEEAVRLLLHRSVGQIAAAMPASVEPSSTARELAVLPALSAKAREAFGIIAERVERSVFALRRLERGDWEAARAAYADFALARVERAR